MGSLPRNLEEMRRLQREIAEKVVLEDRFKKLITTVAGVDMAFSDDLAVTACVVADYDSLKVKARKTSIARLDFPYIPTLLCFREGPPIIDIISSLEPKPDVFLINAQGIAHPILCGCASHVGVLANVPTIGVAARKLCGEYDRELREVGEYAPLYYGGRGVGWVLKSRGGCRPIFVSPGHMVSLNSSLDVVVKCIKDHKFPEPLYLAHMVANEEKRKIAR